MKPRMRTAAGDSRSMEEHTTPAAGDKRRPRDGAEMTQLS